MNTQIQNHHLNRIAYVYIRQSTLNQVRLNQESTERQYALFEKAHAMGWHREDIVTLDNDLGVSGKRGTVRKDFNRLVADVSMGKVGAVFALEASRLSRSCTDWHRLLELCALTHTLIIDEDGIYDPIDFNDQLLLGIKGTMSQAELHFIRARLQGGKANKARKGELRHPLPVGFCYDNSTIILDPDEQVRHVVNLVFQAFEDCGTAFGVVRYFVKHGLQFPKRAYGGTWKGQLFWGHLNHSRVLSILQNPCYAGVYVYGRYQQESLLTPEGTLHQVTRKRPLEQWSVCIKEHHPGYISWEQYLENQTRLAANRTNADTPLGAGPAREGLALLQGLLLCSKCGHKVYVRYLGQDKSVPYYQCTWQHRDGLASRACFSVRAAELDQAVEQRLLSAIQTKEIELVIQAIEELILRQDTINHQWQMKLRRTQYDADLAQRRYEEVDPSNRLVAQTLETRWDDALTHLKNIQVEYGNFQTKNQLILSHKQKNNLLMLANDFEIIWNSPTTKPKDKKRIVRLLIKDVAVTVDPNKRCADLHVRWQSGAFETITLPLPLKNHEKIRTPETVVKKIKGLAAVEPSDQHIADRLNQLGLLSGRGKRFTSKMVQWLRYKHRIPAPCPKHNNELTVKEVCQMFGVSHHVVYYWIDRGLISIRRISQHHPYLISISELQEQTLYQWVQHSTRIKTQQKTVRGAL